jgi:glycosyltransferase involved in cell wall biosynthesis
MKVSALVTVYNLRRFARRAIESALGQTRPPLEVIVVDDGSTDGSADLIFATFGERVRLVRLAPNVGVLRATLEGLRLVRGDIVSFLDADDVWDEEKCRLVAESFERDPAVVFVSHDYRTVDADLRVLREDDPLLMPTRAHARSGDARALSDFMRQSVLRYAGNVWLGSAYSIRRDALDLDAFSTWCSALPDSRLVYQDHPLATFLLARTTGRAAYVDAKLFSYTIHDANYSSADIDLARAGNIVRKGLATRRATHSIVADAGPRLRAECLVQESKIREYTFLAALYAGDYARALREFAACVGSGVVWTHRQGLKELVRLAGVALVGPERFLRVKREGLSGLLHGKADRIAPP